MNQRKSVTIARKKSQSAIPLAFVTICIIQNRVKYVTASTADGVATVEV